LTQVVVLGSGSFKGAKKGVW